jgi:tRNA nucleotidyltransferase/poly(A) polymerase
MDMTGNLFDYFDGQKDLKNGQVKFVGDPVARIKEDALRMIRFLRFEARFGGKSKYTDSYFACVRNQHLINNVSTERVWQEVKSASRNPDSFRRFMSYMITGDWFEQFGIMFNNTNVENAGHINRFVKEFPTFGVAVFLDRSEIGEFFAEFRLSKKEQDELAFFVHMKDHEINEEYFEDLATNGTNKRWLVALAKFKGNDKLSKYIDKWIVPVFPISGKDLIELGITPGKHMGYMLEMLRHKWVMSRFTLTKEQLLEANKENIKNVG